MLRVLTTLLKIAIASLITGAVLSWLDLSAAEILSRLGLTPEAVLETLRKGLEWAIPNIVLGSLIIIPVWLVMFLIRPPRG